MEVFYTASYYGKKRYQAYYDLVLKSLQAQPDVEIVATETGTYLKVLSKEQQAKLKSAAQKHYAAIRKGISWADAVVIEMSVPDFQLGHEATIALQLGKPVLCLSVHEDMSEKIFHPYFYGAKYTKYTANEIVDAFIAKHRQESLSERLNFFLSPSQLTFLENMAGAQDLNVSEYLRLLIDQAREEVFE